MILLMNEDESDEDAATRGKDKMLRNDKEMTTFRATLSRTVAV